MSYIIPSSVSKVRARPTQKNSFGLMPGPEGTCPGATSGKGGCLETKREGGRPTCYVYKAFRNKRVKEILEHNTQVMRSASVADMISILDREFTRFEAKEAVSPNPWYNYRLHWSGDVFSQDYAQALHIAIRKHPDTRFWLYTRSFDWVNWLDGIPNLTLYLSLDAVNVEAGIEAWKACTTARLAYMSEENTGTDALPCPVDSGRMEIEGACCKCALCPIGKSNVWFKIK